MPAVGNLEKEMKESLEQARALTLLKEKMGTVPGLNNKTRARFLTFLDCARELIPVGRVFNIQELSGKGIKSQELLENVLCFVSPPILLIKRKLTDWRIYH